MSTLSPAFSLATLQSKFHAVGAWRMITAAWWKSSLSGTAMAALAAGLFWCVPETKDREPEDLWPEGGTPEASH